MKGLLLFIFLLVSSVSTAYAEVDFPVMYKGRVRPFSVIGKEFDNSLLVIPDKTKEHWYSLSQIETQNRNISRFPDFAYKDLQKAQKAQDYTKAQNLLADQFEMTLAFKIEKFYTRTPLIPFAVGLYMAAFLAFLFRKKTLGLTFFVAAFIVHTLILALRCYILGRPPVSNMDETIIYVPWISAALAFGLTLYTKDALPGLAGALMAAVLLLTPINEGLENIQPVLNSRFWLTIHVLMIVASYGVLIFAALMAHVYLFLRNQTAAKLMLPCLYLGVALLIPGTILGGVWAAESWGRFWDWDPKESWAFISATIYLMVIHAYRFGKIAHFGLSIGTIIGALAISFTWYGVNYILGVGLHSYGFGQGGEFYYVLFVLIETLLICSALIINSLYFNARCDKN